MTRLQFPDSYLFHPEALWLQVVEGSGEALVGVSDFAQDQLGEVVYVDLPRIGATIDADSPFGAIESSKVVSDLIAPASGTVLACNDALRGDPGLVNRSCYQDGWLVRISVSPTFNLAGLLSSQDYKKLLGSSTA